MPRLDPNRVTVKSGPPGPACGFKLDHQLPALQDDFFRIAAWRE